MAELFNRIFNKTTYNQYMMFFIYLQCLYASAAGLSFKFPLQLFMPMLIVCYGIPVLICSLYRIYIIDFTASFTIKEKFALFIFHLILFFSPAMIGIRSFTISSCVVTVPMLILLLKPENFARLYLLNASIFISAILYHPDINILLPAGFVILLAITMIFEYFFFKSEPYSEKRKIKFNEILIILILLGLLPTVAGLLVSLLIPSMKVMNFNDIFALDFLRSHEHNTQPETIRTLMWESIILVVLVAALVAVLTWMHSKVQKKKVVKIELEPAKITEMDQGHKKPRKKKKMSVGEDIRARIIHLYNVFLDEMAEIGFGRKASATPAEYADTLAKSFEKEESGIDAATDVFEHAKYSEEEMKSADLEKIKKAITPIKNAAALLAEKKKEKVKEQN